MLKKFWYDQEYGRSEPLKRAYRRCGPLPSSHLLHPNTRISPFQAWFIVVVVTIPFPPLI